jgi:hypothetical protein
MAAGDYRSCDVCGGKSFYDATLNYEWDKKKREYTLHNLGDWAVICPKCAKTHKCIVVPRESSDNGAGDANG